MTTPAEIARERFTSIKVDSASCNHVFYDIFNAQDDFSAPLVFETKAARAFVWKNSRWQGQPT